MRNRKLYPKDWKRQATECKERAGWRCQKCGIEHGKLRLTWRGTMWPAWLQAAHANHDPNNEDAELVAVCLVSLALLSKARSTAGLDDRAHKAPALTGKRGLQMKAISPEQAIIRAICSQLQAEQRNAPDDPDLEELIQECVVLDLELQILPEQKTELTRQV